MVKAFHHAGIEVILDMVFNHSGGGRRARGHVLLPRPGQRDLLPPRPEDRPLPQLLRLREHAQLQPPGGALHDPHRAPLLGDGDARGRLPVRPRLHPRAGPRRGGAAQPAAAGDDRRRPRHGGHEAHRGGVGRRRALPGGELPELGTLGGMEREVPRRAASVREGGFGNGALPRHAPRRELRPLPRLRAGALAQHELRDLPRRLHPARPRELQREAQPRERREEPGRPRGEPLLELRRGGGVEELGGSGPPARVRSGTS